jgi:hypothetical protein
MKYRSQTSLILPDPPRRCFLQGLAAGGVLLGLSPWIGLARAGEAFIYRFPVRQSGT